MYEEIKAPIQVLVQFKKGEIKPVVIKWQGRKYEVEEVNLIHKTREGGRLLWYFSVSDQTNYFKICFDSRNLNWELEEIYTEG